MTTDPTTPAEQDWHDHVISYYLHGGRFMGAVIWPLFPGLFTGALWVKWQHAHHQPGTLPQFVLGFVVGVALAVLSVVVGYRASTLSSRLFGAVGIPLLTMLSGTAGWLGAPDVPTMSVPGGSDMGWLFLTLGFGFLPAFALLRFLFTREYRKLFANSMKQPAPATSTPGP